MATLVTGRTLERLIGRYAVPAHGVAMILHHSREHFLLESIAGEPAKSCARSRSGSKTTASARRW